LNFSLLPAEAKVFACEKRHPGNLVLVENLFNADELKQLQEELHKAVFPKTAALGLAFGEGKVPTWVEERIVSFAAPRSISNTDWARQSSHEKMFKNDGNSIGLHLDRNLKPDRFVSMVAFIQEPLAGGHTIFPCAVPPAGLKPADEETRNQLADVLPPPKEERLADGSFKVTAGMLVKQGHRCEKALQMCEAVKNAGKANQPFPFVALDTKPGYAMFFFHWTQTSYGMVPDWNVSGWHGGCPSEGDRFIIRSFLHRPELNCGTQNPNVDQFDHSTWRSECLSSPFAVPEL